MRPTRSRNFGLLDVNFTPSPPFGGCHNWWRHRDADHVDVSIETGTEQVTEERPLNERDLRTRSTCRRPGRRPSSPQLARVVLPALLGALVVAGVAYEAVSAQPPQYHQNSVTAKIDSGRWRA